jgi:hypothetical protein
MNSARSDANRRAIRQTLNDLLSLLEKHSVGYGAILRDIASRLDAGGELSADNVHQLLGGMGSLTDVYISRRNGHTVDDEGAANRKLDRLRAKLRERLSDR